jgi:hypothetical protein
MIAGLVIIIYTNCIAPHMPVYITLASRPNDAPWRRMTVQIQGLGTALKILFSNSGQPASTLRLRRNEVVAFFVTFARFAFFSFFFCVEISDRGRSRFLVSLLSFLLLLYTYIISLILARYSSYFPRFSQALHELNIFRELKGLSRSARAAKSEL